MVEAVNRSAGMECCIVELDLWSKRRVGNYHRASSTLVCHLDRGEWREAALAQYYCKVVSWRIRLVDASVSQGT